MNDEPTKEKEILQNRSNNGWPVQQAHFITLKTRRSQAKKSHSEVKWGETTYLPRRLTSEVMETKTMPRNRVAILKKIGKLRLYMTLSESETMMRMMRHSLPGGIPISSLFSSATTSLSLLFKKGLGLCDLKKLIVSVLLHSLSTCSDLCILLQRIGEHCPAE